MHLLFIVNPVSGAGSGKKLPEIIRFMPEYQGLDYEILFSEYAGHARILAAEAIKKKKYTHIIAVGGDGTVNEVGGALYGSEIAFGIVSIGSGNGFARHLGYSTRMKKALRQVLSGAYAYVDMLEMDGLYSLNVSGVGFDAEVAHEFNRLKRRGVFSYIYAGLKMWFRYTEQEYKITVNGKILNERCFILSFANSSQFGNNASIAPHASLKDGLVDICLLKRPKYWNLVPFLFALMSARIDKMGFYKEIQCPEALIEGNIYRVHIDGDAAFMTSPIYLKVHRAVLKTVVPKYAHQRYGDPEGSSL